MAHVPEHLQQPDYPEGASPPIRDNCMDKKVADKIRSNETMAECWKLLDSFYSRPWQLVPDLLADISAF